MGEQSRNMGEESSTTTSLASTLSTTLSPASTSTTTMSLASTSTSAASTTSPSPSPDSSGMSTGWAIVMSLTVLGVVAGCGWAILPGILRIKVGGSTPISQYTFV